MVNNQVDQMTDPNPSSRQQRNRTQAVKTAWLLGLIAITIFMSFIGAAVFGR